MVCHDMLDGLRESSLGDGTSNVPMLFILSHFLEPMDILRSLMEAPVIP